MSRKITTAYGLTGGATGNLDNILSTLLSTNSFATAYASGKVYFYYYDPTSALSESSPSVIKPDNLGVGDAGRWLLLKSWDEAGGNFYYPDYNAADQGLTGNSNTVKYAVDTIGSDVGTIYLRHNSGSANTDYTFSTAETVPAGITLKFEPGARLAIATGITVTINGKLDTGVRQIFSCTGTGAVSFGAWAVHEVHPVWWGENTTPGTTDMTAEINAAFASIAATTIQPTGSYYDGAIPRVVLSGWCKVSAALTGMSAYSYVKSNGAIIQQSDDTKDIFDFSGANKVTVEGPLVLDGGVGQIIFGNANVDESELTIDRVRFNHNHSDAAIEAYLVAPATNLSMTLNIKNCEMTALYQVIKTASGVYTSVKDSWIHLGSINLTRAAVVNGVDSVMLFDNVTGVPHATLTPTGARWIDNYGEFKAINSRFGGEGGGMPIVYQYEATRATGLGGGSVVIQGCQLSCGATAVKNTIVHLMTGIPSLISIRDNNWISKDSTDFISIDGTFDAATYIAALTANDHIMIDIDNNDSVVPLETVGLPSTLINTDPSKVFVSESFRPYIYGINRGLLNFDGPNTGTNIKDEYTKAAVWLVAGNAALTTTSPRFGSACLSLPDATSYITNAGVSSLGAKFCIEGWFKFTDVTDNDQTIINATDGTHGLVLFYNRTAENDKKLRLFASSDGATWDIINGTAGSKIDWANGTWYKVAVEYTGARYSVYVGIAGTVVTEDIGANSASVICAVTSMEIGHPTTSLIGAVDCIRTTFGDFRYGGLFIPESQKLIVD